MAISLHLTPEELKVVWTAVQQYVDNQVEVDEPSQKEPLVETAEALQTRLDELFLEVSMALDI